MQDAVDDDAMQLTLIGLIQHLCIRTHSVEADEDITTEAMALAIVESDDVCVVIMLQILQIYLQDALIGAEKVADGAYTLAV